MKLDIAEDNIPPLVRALEHFAAYLEATKRPDNRYLALAEELKRKQPGAEVARPNKLAKHGRHASAYVSLFQLPDRQNTPLANFATQALFHQVDSGSSRVLRAALPRIPKGFEPRTMGTVPLVLSRFLSRKRFECSELLN